MSYKQLFSYAGMIAVAFIGVTVMIFHLGKKLNPKKDKKISVSKKKLKFIKTFLCKVEEDCCESERISIYKLPVVLAIINYTLNFLFFTSFVLHQIFYNSNENAYKVINIIATIFGAFVFVFVLYILALFEKKSKEKKACDQDDEMNFK